MPPTNTVTAADGKPQHHTQEKGGEMPSPPSHRPRLFNLLQDGRGTQDKRRGCQAPAPPTPSRTRSNSRHQRTPAALLNVVETRARTPQRENQHQGEARRECDRTCEVHTELHRPSKETQLEKQHRHQQTTYSLASVWFSRMKHEKWETRQLTARTSCLRDNSKRNKRHYHLAEKDYRCK